MKWCSVGIKGPNVCQGNTSHPIPLPPQGRLGSQIQAVDAHLLQSLPYYVFWDAFLVAMITTSDYLSYYSLSVLLAQSCLDFLLRPLSSKCFQPQKCCPLDVFLHHSDCSMLKSQEISKKIPKPGHHAPTTMPRSKSTRSHYSPILMSDGNISSWFFYFFFLHDFFVCCGFFFLLCYYMIGCFGWNE